VVGTIAYFAIIAPFCWKFGVIGAALAFLLGNAATVVVMIWQLVQEHRRIRPGRTSAQAR
jgi:Na+-driven multidrug efflux pump